MSRDQCGAQLLERSEVMLSCCLNFRVGSDKAGDGREERVLCFLLSSLDKEFERFQHTQKLIFQKDLAFPFLAHRPVLPAGTQAECKGWVTGPCWLVAFGTVMPECCSSLSAPLLPALVSLTRRHHHPPRGQSVPC